MQRTLITFTAMAALVTTASRLPAQSELPEEMRVAQFLVGTWQCADTVGDQAGTYTTTITNAVGNRWLRQTYDFPVSKHLPNGLAGEWFMGYDPRNQKWLRFGAMNDGMYFAMSGKRTENMWSYSYVLPGPNASSVYTRKSDVEYTIVGPSYPEAGKIVTEHHTCRKSPSPTG